MNNNPILVLGAGMTGLLAAFLIKKRCPHSDVVVVDRAGEAGAQYREKSLEGFGSCDNAMRMIYETGIDEMDTILRGILPEEEWRVLPGNDKDIVGIYWRGRLQMNSGYLDLRRLEPETLRRCEEEILACARSGAHAASDDAARHLCARFGPTTARYLEDVLRKLHRLPAGALHQSATEQPAMDRVILYDEDRMASILESGRTRRVIAWPEQSTFPDDLRPPQAGLYPRRFGMNRVIDAAVGQLERRGVRFLYGCSAVSLTGEGGVATRVELDNGLVFERPRLVVAASGLPATLKLLRGPGDSTPIGSRPPSSWIVFLRTREPPAMGGLYHFWCFDEPYCTFRVTHFANYCPGAVTDAGYPICVELWSDDRDAAQATSRAVRELQEMSILGGADSISARGAAPAANLHALNSLESVRNVRAIRDEIHERSPGNMITVGPFMEDGMVLLYQIWRKMHPMIIERL